MLWFGFDGQMGVSFHRLQRMRVWFCGVWALTLWPNLSKYESTLSVWNPPPPQKYFVFDCTNYTIITDRLDLKNRPCTSDRIDRIGWDWPVWLGLTSFNPELASFLSDVDFLGRVVAVGRHDLLLRPVRQRMKLLLLLESML
jgi:hypothetical protein